MNHLVPATTDGQWHLPTHAHIVVYDKPEAERDLLTIYDCGAAQKPPSAQILGVLESIDVRAVTQPSPTGQVISLRERGTLERVAESQYRILSR